MSSQPTRPIRRRRRVLRRNSRLPIRCPSASVQTKSRFRCSLYQAASDSAKARTHAAFKAWSSATACDSRQAASNPGASKPDLSTLPAIATGSSSSRVCQDSGTSLWGPDLEHRRHVAERTRSGRFRARFEWPALAVRQPEVRDCQCAPRPPALGELLWALSLLAMPVECAPESEVADRAGVALADA
jgi:hypothetical protein